MEEIKQLTIEEIKAIESRKDRIELLHKSILFMQIRTFEFAVMLGQELSEAKSELPHGQFIKWITENLPFMTRMTANRYMNVYENQNYLREELGNKLELKRAYSLLNKRSQKKVNNKNDAVQAVKNKVDSHLLDTIRETRKKIAKAKRKLLSGKPIEKAEKKLLIEDTESRKKKELDRISRSFETIEKSKQKLKEYEQLEKLAEM